MKKKRPQLPPLDLHQRYSIQESCGYLRISRPSFYKKLKAGEIYVLKEGARVFVPGTEIARNSTIAAKPPNIPAPGQWKGCGLRDRGTYEIEERPNTTLCEESFKAHLRSLRCATAATRTRLAQVVREMFFLRPR